MNWTDNMVVIWRANDNPAACVEYIIHAHRAAMQAARIDRKRKNMAEMPENKVKT